MKPAYAITVFIILVASAVAAGIDSLWRTKVIAESDVEHALAMTLLSCEPDRIDADTIRVYRDNISMDFLRDTAFIALTITDDNGKRQPTLTAHTGLSTLQLWQLSDKRASGLLTLLAALWLALSLGLTHRPESSQSAKNAHFTEEIAAPAPCLQLPADGTQAATTPIEGLRLTPMQRELVEMFIAAPNHRLLKQDICDRLWPKKPDASATLYTLIRRIKPTLSEAGMHIECERGQAYRLTTVSSS